MEPKQQVKQLIVHNKKAPFDVYIGRKNKSAGLGASKWANPFIIGKNGSREEVIKKYEHWIVEQPNLLKEIGELDGKILGCWCDYPNVDCHGRILLKLLDEYKKKNSFTLSASKIQTYELCSYQYYSKYVLKLPDETNDGALRGSSVHLIFEVLLNDRRRPLYEEILKNGTITKTPSVLRLVNKTMKKFGLGRLDNKGENNFQLIDEMILVGLNCDFYYEGKQLDAAEKRITIDGDGYKIVGFIDKTATKDNVMHIGDYKSSSKKSDNSTQAMTYALWAKRVKNMDAICDFIYLRFPTRPNVHYKFEDHTLDGFEYYLKSIYPILRDFNEKQAILNLAANKPYAKEGFTGPLVCGRAKKKGELKKDGSPMYFCSFKFKFKYYALKNENGLVIKTSLKNDLVPKLESKEYIELMDFNGCPAFNNFQVADFNF